MRQREISDRHRAVQVLGVNPLGSMAELTRWNLWLGRQSGGMKRFPGGFIYLAPGSHWGDERCVGVNARRGRHAPVLLAALLEHASRRPSFAAGE